jgi:hypothetical protein
MPEGFGLQTCSTRGKAGSRGDKEAGEGCPDQRL